MSPLFTISADASPHLRRNAMLRQITAFDWEGSALGPIAAWPEALRAAARIMLCASAPVGLLVGQDGWLLFNDPLREAFGTLDSDPLGRSVFDVLPHAAVFYRSVIDRCAAGEAPRFEDYPLRLIRGGRAVKAWFSLEFVPVLEPGGGYLGALFIVSETTGRLQVERRLRRSERELEEALQMSEVVAQELDHRIKNIFAMVDALVSLSLRDSPQMHPFAEALQRRLMALSRAHDLAHGWAQRPEARPGAIPLRGLISELLRPYAGHEQPRVAIEGEDPAIPTALVTPLTLVFHELATNAAKYGALAARDGAIVLDIRTRGEDLEIRWKERMAALPLPRESRGGFGSRLLAKVVEGQLGGRLSRTWESDGMCLILSLPRGRLEHSSANAWP